MVKLWTYNHVAISQLCWLTNLILNMVVIMSKVSECVLDYWKSLSTNWKKHLVIHNMTSQAWEHSYWLLINQKLSIIKPKAEISHSKEAVVSIRKENDRYETWSTWILARRYDGPYERLIFSNVGNLTSLSFKRSMMTEVGFLICL